MTTTQTTGHAIDISHEAYLAEARQYDEWHTDYDEWVAEHRLAAR